MEQKKGFNGKWKPTSKRTKGRMKPLVLLLKQHFSRHSKMKAKFGTRMPWTPRYRVISSSIVSHVIDGVSTLGKVYLRPRAPNGTRLVEVNFQLVWLWPFPWVVVRTMIDDKCIKRKRKRRVVCTLEQMNMKSAENEQSKQGKLRIQMFIEGWKRKGDWKDGDKQGEIVCEKLRKEWLFKSAN